MMIESFAELGSRVTEARQAAGFTQSDLAAKLGLDRTAITKIEAGTRRVDSLELGRMAEVLHRPVWWFLTSPPSAIVSRRREREGLQEQSDVLLEILTADVEQLVAMRLLHPPDRVDLGLKVDSLDAAEEAARLVRHRLGQPAEPIIDLADAGERLGLYAFVLELDAPVEGAYVALERGGVALIQGREPVGKRRFTLAHELGHHVLQDAYSTEWVPGNRDERERLINALAIHFLAPRPGIAARWEALDGPKDPRNAAIFVAAEFGVSWSAMCGHLRNLGLIPEGRREELSLSAPTRLEQLERGLVLTAQPGPRTLPRAFTAAVALGFRRQLLGRVRALEMLRGVLDEGDLPREPSVPLDALLGDIEST